MAASALIAAGAVAVAGAVGGNVVDGIPGISGTPVVPTGLKGKRLGGLTYIVGGLSNRYPYTGRNKKRVTNHGIHWGYRVK